MDSSIPSIKIVLITLYTAINDEYINTYLFQDYDMFVSYRFSGGGT